MPYNPITGTFDYYDNRMGAPNTLYNVRQYQSPTSVPTSNVPRRGNQGQQPQQGAPRRNPWENYQFGPNAGQPIGSPDARGQVSGGGTQGGAPGGGVGGRSTQSTRGQVAGGRGASGKPSRDDQPVNGYNGGGGGGAGGGGGGQPSQGSGPVDYGPGYDSLGNAAFGGSNDFGQSDSEKRFNEYKRLGLVDWTGSYKNWEKNGQPRAGQYTPDQMAAIVSGHRDPWDFAYGQGNAPAGGIPGGGGVPPTGAPGSIPGPTTGAPGGSGYAPSPGYIPPQNAADWQNPGSVASLNYYQGLAGDVNQFNWDQYNAQWGADQNRFAMDQSNTAMQMDWLMNQDTLNYNYWNSMLGADANAYDSAANLYANLDRNQAEAWANAYGADAGLYGSMYGADANLAGGMYGTNINAMNDWYTNQLRAQTDKEIATMQAFGRDQLPNTRFLQNWT